MQQDVISRNEEVFHVICRITHTWVDGKCLLNNRHLTTLDVESLLKKAQEWKTILCTSNPFADKGSPDPCLSPF